MSRKYWQMEIRKEVVLDVDVHLDDLGRGPFLSPLDKALWK